MNTITYFKRFEEGDNITITADFINNVENLETFLQKTIKNNNELQDNQEILLKTLKLILKEMYD